jgi:hypothetical protein
VRDGFGNVIQEFPGSGTSIVRLYDWQGRLRSTYHNYVDPSRSIDGEPFADAATKQIYNELGLTPGPGLSAGQLYERKYTNKSQEFYTLGREVFLGDSLYTRRRGFSRTGALIADTLFFTDGLKITRQYQYNWRGQRSQATDVITASGGSVSGETRARSPIPTTTPAGWPPWKGKRAGAGRALERGRSLRGHYEPAPLRASYW